MWQQAKMNKTWRIKICFTKPFVNNIGTVILTEKESAAQHAEIFHSLVRLWLLSNCFHRKWARFVLLHFSRDAFPLLTRSSTEFRHDHYTRT
jgi:hypothetical protein